MLLAEQSPLNVPNLNVLPQAWNWRIVLAAAVIGLSAACAFDARAQAQRVWGVDISYWNCTHGHELTQANWNTAFAAGSRVFVQLRATRGGTNGVDQTAGYPGGSGGSQTLQRRYDDPRFFQNLKRALAAGMQAGAYHRGQQVSTTPGAAEAEHMLQVAGPWMRPGYMVPMLDWEDGGFNATQAQWAIDFSDRIYEVMQIRPCVYIGGANSQSLQSISQALRDALAKPATFMPSVTNRFYMLWNPRYTNDVDWTTTNPKDTYAGFYGPWDDYGDPHPWSFWQYLSTQNIPGFNAADTTVDGNICHGDLEYLRNSLVPAVWWNNTSGDWSTTNNWNCGQPPILPDIPPDQPTPYESPDLPGTRLPGELGGSGPTSPAYDTVILERPNANITVTLSGGTYNIRKLYMRETLNITGGSLTINYNPAYRPDDSPTCLHAGPVSAQFTGPVTLGGSGTLKVNTLQVDATRTFSVNGGSLAFTAISLLPGTTPATLAIGGDATYGAYPGSSATITNGAGSGSSGRITLSGGTRTFNVNGGVDLYAKVPISNGGLIKSGPGTLHLDAANSYAAGTTLNAGTLAAGVAGALPGNVTNAGGVLKLDSTTAMASSASLVLTSSPVGVVNLAFTGTQTIAALYFGGVRQAAGTWAASGAAHNSAAFTGPGVLNVTTGPTTSSTSLSRTSGASPSAYGDSLTFRATVAGSSPTGTVQFKVNGVAAGSPVALVGGSATLVTNRLPVSGSPHQLTAFYSGDSNNAPSDNSASPLSQFITAKALTAALTGTVSKTYDGTTAATLAPANYSLPGVLSGDTVTLNSPASGAYDTKNAGSAKTVTVTGLSIAGPAADNYTLSSPTVAGPVGVISALATSCSLVASVNPSEPGSNVTFTAVVNGVPPAADLPTGEVVFSANGTPFATQALAGGSGDASTVSLPLGTNTVTAQYVGDGNFLGSTGSVAQVVRLFTTCSQTNALLSVTKNQDGTLTLTFEGTPQAEYYLLASPELAAPVASWAPVAGSTNTVTNSSGVWQFTVTNSAAQQFYRSKALTPCQ